MPVDNLHDGLPLNALNAYLAVARRRSYAAAAMDLGVSKTYRVPVRRAVTTNSFELMRGLGRVSLEENLGAVDVVLTPDELSEIERAFRKIPVEGARLSAGHLTLIDR